MKNYILGLFILVFLIVVAGIIAFNEFALTGHASDSKPVIIMRVLLDEEFNGVRPGSSLLVEVVLKQAGESVLRDVVLGYRVHDGKGHEIKKGEQTIAIETQLSSVLNVQIPEDTESGNYILAVEVRDIGDGHLLASSSQEFFVEGDSFLEKISKRDLSIAGILIILILFVLVVISLRRQKRNIEELSYKVDRLARRR